MSNKNIKKDFDAVGFQRQRREELSKLYNSNPEEFDKQLAEIRKKYRNKFHQKEKHTANRVTTDEP